MDICLGPLKDADGSTKFTHGHSSVLACVRGPDQVSQQKELIDKATVMVHYESKSGQSCCSDRQMEHFVAQICERIIITTMHPRTSVLINLIELHDDGCLSACAINAAVLALIDAGIPMRSMVSAATCCVAQDGSILLGPSRETMEEAVGTVTLVLERETKQVLSLLTSKGSLTTEQLNNCLSTLTEKCVELFQEFTVHFSDTYPIS